MHGNGHNEEFLDLEFREIRDTIVAEKAVAVKSWSAIFTKASWRKRLFLGMGIQAFGQLSGINVINYYGPDIYKLLGIDTGESLKIIGISGTLSIVWCFLGLLLLDRVGRIKPMIVATSGCAAALLVNSVLSKYYVIENNENPNNNALRAMVAMNFIFSFFFTMIGIITWVYPAEVFPTEIRARGNSLSTFTNWSLNLVAVVCYIFLYPETKGRTLEQMDQLFGDQVVPHALQDAGAAEIAMKEKFKVSSVVSHVEDEQKSV